MNTHTTQHGTLTRGTGVPLAAQLAQRFAERIDQGLLTAGARLPSVRDCAQQHGVSPHTVVVAYDQLLAQGLLEARKQRGFFVRERLKAAAKSATAAAKPHPRPFDATALIRGMFQADPRRSPGLGTLPSDWLDGPMLQSALRKALSHEDISLLYGEPAGDARLRAALTQRLADIGVSCAPAQIISTVGATHALDLINRTLMQPGEAVMVDDPGWAIEYARLTQAGMRLLAVPRGADGPDLAVMARLVEQHRPRFYVTVSVLHNPTGHSLSAAQAHQVLKLAEAGDFRIVEDDSYALLAPNHAPRLSTLDGLKRTIYVSGFSKILTPSWRVGFVAANEDTVRQLTELKLLSTLTTPPLAERAVAMCLEQGLLRRHAERVLSQLDAARTRTVRLALAAGCRFVTPPAGLFGWIDVGMDSGQLAQRLLDEGWTTAPGVLFSPTRQAGSLMRINFTTAQDAKFWALLQRLREAAV